MHSLKARAEVFFLIMRLSDVTKEHETFFFFLQRTKLTDAKGHLLTFVIVFSGEIISPESYFVKVCRTFRKWDKGCFLGP